VSSYVENIEGAYRIANSRVSLDSIVIAFNRGASPESIQRSFSTLSLEEVYGAIAYYLANQKEIDKYLEIGEHEFADLDSRSRINHADWYRRLQSQKESSFA